MKKKVNTLSKVALPAVLFIALLLIGSCATKKEKISISEQEKEVFNQVESDTVKIANEEAEYEIIIIEPGFTVWLASVARPEGYYSQNFLENRNKFLVREWNQRAMLPLQFDPNLYQMPIDYEQDVDYGYDVNYKLYNYFIYFQRKYNQRLGAFFPRI